MKLILLFLFLTSGLAQAQDTLVVERFSSSLYLGESLHFGNRSIKFKKLISDSRCPRNVTCIWAGEAEVLVEVYQEGKPFGTKLLTISAGEKPLSFLQEFFPDEEIALNSLLLTPYPERPGGIDPEAYRLDLEVQVTRKISQ